MALNLILIYLGIKRSDFHEFSKQRSVRKSESNKSNKIVSLAQDSKKEESEGKIISSKSTLKIKKSESVFFHLSIDYKP